MPYLRRATEGGGVVQNPAFDEADRVTQDAVLYYESEVTRCRGWADRLRDAERKKNG